MPSPAAVGFTGGVASYGLLAPCGAACCSGCGTWAWAATDDNAGAGGDDAQGVVDNGYGGAVGEWGSLTIELWTRVARAGAGGGAAARGTLLSYAMADEDNELLLEVRP